MATAFTNYRSPKRQKVLLTLATTIAPCCGPPEAMRSTWEIGLIDLATTEVEFAEGDNLVQLFSPTPWAFVGCMGVLSPRTLG